VKVKGYHYPLCISGQHKSVFHDLFCSIANSPLQSLTFLYPSLYLSVGDLVASATVSGGRSICPRTQTSESQKHRVLHAHPAGRGRLQFDSNASNRLQHCLGVG
ncbi:hypothetical protein Pcinc_037635, partial [Petrolisthes cinctipes]